MYNLCIRLLLICHITTQECKMKTISLRNTIITKLWTNQVSDITPAPIFPPVPCSQNSAHICFFVFSLVHRTVAQITRDSESKLVNTGQTSQVCVCVCPKNQD